MDKLKPCPFCGRNPSRVRQHYVPGTAIIHYSVECKAPMIKCFVKPKTCYCKTEEQAIEAWNKRADAKPTEIDFDYEAED